MDANSKEKVLQEVLFNHLWLLDPSWERATDAHLEERIGTSFPEFPLPQDEKDSRLDIRYKRASGAHVIVELKRYSVSTDSFTLARQIAKYKNIMQKVLMDRGEERPYIEIVCIVGNPLTDWSFENGRQESREILRAKSARVMTYDELLDSARNSYSEYMRGREGLDRIRQVIESLEG
ncbi:hypothetical protein [Streptomyces antibioticus]|uniref:hypothetical protein n=1 Tax=Streptomyces antibioticus TaxID=1890 RepID=UPI0036DC28B1